jgi:hypothetical protein
MRERTFNIPNQQPDEDWCIYDDIRGVILAMPDGSAKDAYVKATRKLHQDISVKRFLEIQKDFRTGDEAIDFRNATKVVDFIRDFFDGVVTLRNLQLAYLACRENFEKLPPAQPELPAPPDTSRGIKRSATRRLGDVTGEAETQAAAKLRKWGSHPEALEQLRQHVNTRLSQRRGSTAAGKSDRSVGVTSSNV